MSTETISVTHGKPSGKIPYPQLAQSSILDNIYLCYRRSREQEQRQRKEKEYFEIEARQQRKDRKAILPELSLQQHHTTSTSAASTEEKKKKTMDNWSISTTVPEGIPLINGHFKELYLSSDRMEAGANGQVHIVKHKIDKCQYAVKSVECAVSERADELKEAIVLAKINHPNIVRYRYSWTEIEDETVEDEEQFEEMAQTGKEKKEVLFIAMDYIEGKPLDEFLLSDDSFEPIDFYRMGSELSSAVGYLHLRGILHNDIKAGNIMIEHESLKAILIDIGSYGRLLSNGYAKSHQRVNKRIDDKDWQEEESIFSDIFDLGKVLYNMTVSRGQLAVSKGISGLLSQMIDHTAARRPMLEKVNEMFTKKYAVSIIGSESTKPKMVGSLGGQMATMHRELLEKIGGLEEMLKAGVQQQINTNLSRVFVGGLSPQTTNAELRVYFSAFGEVAQAEIAFNPATQQSQGYAIVFFTTRESAVRSVQAINGSADLHLCASLSYPNSSHIEQVYTMTGPTNSSIYVTGLGPNLGEIRIQRLFASFGTITSVKAKLLTGKNCSFVQFLSKAEACRAICAMDRTSVQVGETLELIMCKWALEHNASAHRMGIPPAPSSSGGSTGRGIRHEQSSS